MLPLTVTPIAAPSTGVVQVELTRYVEELITGITDDSLDVPVVQATLPGTAARRLAIRRLVVQMLPQIWTCSPEEAGELYDAYVRRLRTAGIRTTRPVVVAFVVHSRLRSLA